MVHRRRLHETLAADPIGVTLLASLAPEHRAPCGELDRAGTWCAPRHRRHNQQHRAWGITVVCACRAQAPEGFASQHAREVICVVAGTGIRPRSASVGVPPESKPTRIGFSSRSIPIDSPPFTPLGWSTWRSSLHLQTQDALGSAMGRGRAHERIQCPKPPLHYRGSFSNWRFLSRPSCPARGNMSAAP